MARKREVDGNNILLGEAILPPIIEVLTRDADGNPLTWTENGAPCSATYNLDGTVATLTKDATTRTFTYVDGKMATCS